MWLYSFENAFFQALAIATFVKLIFQVYSQYEMNDVTEHGCYHGMKPAWQTTGRVIQNWVWCQWGKYWHCNCDVYYFTWKIFVLISIAYWMLNVLTKDKQYSLLIAYVAFSKRHQLLDKIWIIFTCTNRKSPKLFVRKLCQKHTHLLQACAVWNARITASVCCAKQDCVKFRGCSAWQEFFWKQRCRFLWFSEGKKKKNIQISSSCWWRFQLAISPIGFVVMMYMVLPSVWM